MEGDVDYVRDLEKPVCSLTDLYTLIHLPDRNENPWLYESTSHIIEHCVYVLVLKYYLSRNEKYTLIENWRADINDRSSVSFTCHNVAIGLSPFHLKILHPPDIQYVIVLHDVENAAALCPEALSFLFLCFFSFFTVLHMYSFLFSSDHASILIIYQRVMSKQISVYKY